MPRVASLGLRSMSEILDLHADRQSESRRPGKRRPRPAAGGLCRRGLLRPRERDPVRQRLDLRRLRPRAGRGRRRGAGHRGRPAVPAGARPSTGRSGPSTTSADIVAPPWSSGRPTSAGSSPAPITPGPTASTARCRTTPHFRRARPPRASRPRPGGAEPEAGPLRRLAGLDLRQPGRHGHATSTDFVAPIARRLAAAKLDRLTPVATLDLGEVRTNWKFLMENFIEPYHVQFVHKTTTEQPLSDHSTFIDGHCLGSAWSRSRARRTAAAAATPWRSIPALPDPVSQLRARALSSRPDRRAPQRAAGRRPHPAAAGHLSHRRAEPLDRGDH